MSRIVKSLIVIGFFLLFLFIQFTVINQQRLEILDTQNILVLEYQEHDYLINIEFCSEAMILQEYAWNEMKNLANTDFISVVEKLQRRFQDHGWMFTSFQRLEEETDNESNSDEFAETASNKLFNIKSISYEIQFIIVNGNVTFPMKLLSEATESVSIDNIRILINDDETLGILNITYRRQEINDELILEI